MKNWATFDAKVAQLRLKNNRLIIQNQYTSFCLYISQNSTAVSTICNHKQTSCFRFFAFKISAAYKSAIMTAKQNGQRIILCKILFTYVSIFF